MTEQWQPVETAPKDREILLTDARTAEAYAVAQFDTNKQGEGRWFTADGAGYHFEVFTHWMELPAQPPHAGDVS
jgi:hypothetical protein